MRKTLEMITVLRMQNMREIHKNNMCFVTKSFFEFSENILLGLSALRAPTVGPYAASKPLEYLTTGLEKTKPKGKD
jgi:hypothetical protein